MTTDPREVARVIADAVRATLLQVRLESIDINRVAQAIGANAAQALCTEED